ncbi:MAG: hypothetical protein QXD03_04715 [Candidatus Anstonellales archaeon]
MVEKYFITIKDTDIVPERGKIYFGDGLYRKFKKNISISIACDYDINDSVIINEYNFDRINDVIQALNYGFNEIYIFYNPNESYENLYYYCIGKKFSVFLSKKNYKVILIPISSYGDLADAVSKLRSDRTIHIVNNSIDYIKYKGKVINNSSISRFIKNNSDNIILVSFSSYHCKSNISHICLDSSYNVFKDALDSVISGKNKSSVIVNDNIYINSSLFKFFHHPNLDYIMSISSEVF